MGWTRALKTVLEAVLRKGHPPPSRTKLTREDVLRMIEENGGPAGLDLSGRDLSWIDLGREAISREAELVRRARGHAPDWQNERNGGIDLNGVNLANANLFGANLAYADLKDAILEGAMMKASCLAKSWLRRANFRYVDLSRADMSGARVNDADLRDGVDRCPILFCAVGVHASVRSWLKPDPYQTLDPRLRCKPGPVCQTICPHRPRPEELCSVAVCWI